jgi:hypothetical protein
MKSILIAALALVTTSFAQTQPTRLCDGFVPENNMKIPVGWSGRAGRDSGITEKDFNDVLDKIELLYKDEMAAQGGTMQINRQWTDGTVNAYATRQGNIWVVNMFGGLARHPSITRDGFALAACHETGHHLGGAPKFTSWFGGNDWAAVEGEADYFATLKCIRRYFADEDNAAILAKMQVDPVAQAECVKQFQDKNEQLICIRGAMAGFSVSDLFKELRNEQNLPKFDTPDANVVDTMFEQHPGTQCRLDTYYAGALCTAPISEKLNDTDYKPGSCDQAPYTEGTRPHCWFKPN